MADQRSDEAEVTFWVSRLVFPVHTLGPGIRAGVWTQGCTIHCSGCMAVDTWARRADSETTVASVLDWFSLLPLDDLTGLTVSGGEPTEQPEALRHLIDGVRSCTSARTDFDILIYSGRRAEWLLTDGREILAGADAVMADPYVEPMAGHLPLRGSDNQRLLPLTPLGNSRYFVDQLPARERIQLEVENGRVRIIGIPTPGVLSAVTQRAAELGLELHGTSWRR